MSLHRTCRRAFTLVELLVVIGIIALLISMLLPALNKAREAAKKVACSSNMRTLGQLVFIYAAENKQSFPPLSQWNASTLTGTSGGQTFPIWQTNNQWRGLTLWPLIKTSVASQVRVCPTVASELTPPNIVTADLTTRGHYSYRYNYILAGSESAVNSNPDGTGVPGRINCPHPKQIEGAPAGNCTPTPYKQVPNASETLLMMDYPQIVVNQMNGLGGADRGMPHSFVVPDNPFIRAASTDGVLHQAVRALAPVHSPKPVGPGHHSYFTNGFPCLQGDVNILYCDGSVRSVTVKQGDLLIGGSNMTTAGPQMTLDNSTANGHLKPMGRGIIPGTRLDPKQVP